MHRRAFTPSLFVVAALLLSGETARAGQVAIGALKDNTIYAEGDLSNGAGDHFFAGLTAQQTVRRGLVAFNVAGAVPAGATITDAVLSLHVSRTIGGPAEVALHRLLADWGEGASHAAGEEGGGAPAEAGDATWDHTFFPGEFWATDGGDFDPLASATGIVSDNGTYGWGSAGELVADVQAWLDDPSTNFGWLLLGEEGTPFSTKRFDSRTNPTEAFRPVLMVAYVPSPPVASLLLVAAISRRRRRRA